MDKAVLKKRAAIHLNRRCFYLLLFTCFIFPLFLTTCVAKQGEEVILVALLSSLLGGIGGYYLLWSWERRLQKAVARLVEEKCQQVNMLPSQEVENFRHEFERARLGYEHQIDLLNSSVQKSKEQVNELNLQMDKKLEEVRLAYLEYEDLRKEYARLDEEYKRYKAEIQSQFNHKESLISDYQKTISEQRSIIEKKQHYISKLEGKVRDLMYEIRSLLQIEDPLLEKIPMVKEEEPAQMSIQQRPYDHSLQVTRYVSMAEQFTGADHLGGRFIDSAMHRYAIDLRPLFDNLRDESSGLIFVYSQVEDKFLFVNKIIKNILGWSGEKFMKDFEELVSQGYTDWRQAISEISKERQKRLQLVLKTKTGEQKPFDCYMGLITKGPFANYVIGMMIT